MNPFEQGLQRYYSADQLSRIQSQRIGIGGAGGLGSNIAVILTRSGFKHFEIIDSDVIEASNLNRQYYFLDEIGQEKVLALKRRLLQINPDLDVHTHCLRWGPAIGEKFFKGCDFVVEAFDQVDNKHAFITFYQDKHKYIISGSGMAGLKEKREMHVKKVGNVYIAGDLSTDVAEGHPPLAPRVTACAAMMAEVIMDLTLGIRR
ncbi:MAG TPA: sulfur carrier protein ThiS adenylyltransferase ThiF [Bacilli bacterium]|nr:sulfur carrier protein ThiS adenylyltransferase ThiF [Bacilli bacterium]